MSQGVSTKTNTGFTPKSFDRLDWLDRPAVMDRLDGRNGLERPAEADWAEEC